MDEKIEQMIRDLIDIDRKILTQLEKISEKNSEIFKEIRQVNVRYSEEFKSIIWNAMGKAPENLDKLQAKIGKNATLIMTFIPIVGGLVTAIIFLLTKVSWP